MTGRSRRMPSVGSRRTLTPGPARFYDDLVNFAASARPPDLVYRPPRLLLHPVDGGRRWRVIPPSWTRSWSPSPPIRPRLLPPRRRPARAGPCHPAGRRSRGLPAWPGAAGAAARAPIPVPVRRRDDLPQGDRRAAEGLRPGVPARGQHRAGHQGHGVEQLLPRPDRRGPRWPSCASEAIRSSTSTAA